VHPKVQATHAEVEKHGSSYSNDLETAIFKQKIVSAFEQFGANQLI